MLHVSGHKGSAWKNDTKHLCQFTCFNTDTCTNVKSIRMKERVNLQETGCYVFFIYTSNFIVQVTK